MKSSVSIVILFVTVVSLSSGCDDSSSRSVSTGSSHSAPGASSVAGPTKCGFKLLIDSGGKETVVGPDSRVFTLDHESFKGSLSIFSPLDGMIRLAGHGFDQQNKVPPYGFLVFSGPKCILFAEPLERPDIARHLNSPALLRTGFEMLIPASVIKQTRFKNFHIVVLFDNGTGGYIDVAMANAHEGMRFWQKETSD
jgi:hypothetical protein